MRLTKKDGLQSGQFAIAILTFYHGNTSWEIEINSLQDKDRRQRLSSYIASLLHEMLHVYLNIYACRQKACKPKKTIYKQWDFHGEFWQDAAWALERTCAYPHVLGLRLTMGRETSLAYDLAEYHESIPRAMVENWGMSYDDVKMLLAVFNRDAKDRVKGFGSKDTMVTKGGGVTIKATKSGKVIQVRGDTTRFECSEVVELLENGECLRISTRIPGTERSTSEATDVECVIM